jgi:hypothetical protein
MQGNVHVPAPSKFNTSSALETTCDSRRGILAQWQRLRAKFYCTLCQTMQTVQSVAGITQAPEHATYAGCILDCGHSRDIGVSVHRTKAVTEAMEAAERESLLSDMADGQLL